MSGHHEPASTMQNGNRPDLRADCENCFGLCCAALPFAASADFAIDKNAGQPCAHLRSDFRCGVHADLRERGFRGCTVYDCFGAGQKVAQVTYGGRDWLRHPESAGQMFEVFPVMKQLHELLFYLSEALALEAAEPIREELARELGNTEQLTALAPEAILELDVPAIRAETGALLLRASELYRADARRRLGNAAPAGRKADRRGADLIGANLRNADLRAVSLRGAYLIAANLSGADLRAADLIGADLRDADLSGADLTGSLFLTQAQLNSAKGDARTKLPPAFSRPAHWQP